MAKKEQPPKKDPNAFTGFDSLKDGLAGFKKKLEEEEKKKAEAAKQGKKPPPAPPKPRPRENVRPSSQKPEDDLTFHRMMAGVVPLDEKAKRVPVTSETTGGRGRIPQAELRKQAKAEAEAVMDHLHLLVDDAVRFEVSDDGRRVEGRRVDVPPSLLRELRRGSIPIDGRIDLHGLRPDDAREAVLAFLKEKRARGERCVLVIHGKGEGVLRGELSAWLSQGRAREHVAAFATAREEDGGEGACYVALRR